MRTDLYKRSCVRLTTRRVSEHLPNWQASCSGSANPCGCAGQPRSNRAPRAADAPAALWHNTPVFLYITPIILYATPIVLYANVRQCAPLYAVVRGQMSQLIEWQEDIDLRGAKTARGIASTRHRGLPVRQDATFTSGLLFAARKSGRSHPSRPSGCICPYARATGYNQAMTACGGRGRA